MLFAPGGLAVTQFQVELSGNLVALVNPAAVIYRGVAPTSIVPTISSPATGLYSVSFTVPNNWQNYDAIACNLSGSVNGRAVSLFKSTGVVLSLPTAPDNAAIAVILDLVEQLHRFRGLKPGTPWLVGDGQQSAGDITLDVTDDGTTTTVSRNP